MSYINKTKEFVKITEKIVKESTKKTIDVPSNNEIVDEIINEMVKEMVVEIVDEMVNEMVDKMIDEMVDENELKDSNNKLYKTNKTKFCATAAIKLRKHKTERQIKTKLQNLKTRYSNEKKEVTDLTESSSDSTESSRDSIESSRDSTESSRNSTESSSKTDSNNLNDNIEDEQIINDIIQRYLHNRLSISYTDTIPKSNFWYQNIFFKYDEKRFRIVLRINKLTFWKIIDIIKNNLVFNSKKSTIWDIATRFSISEGLVIKYAERIIIAIQSLRIQYIVWPQNDYRKQVIHGFEQIEKFPDIIGIIDGTHAYLFEAS
ncbi:27407_t:CDS:2, partial [Racocetra persica]